MQKKNLLLVLVIGLFMLVLVSCEKETNPLETSEATSVEMLSVPTATAEWIPPPPPSYACVRTPGYWKNHPEEWPTDWIEIGGITYSKDEAIELLNQPIQGDKTLTMFKALVATRLNLLNGSNGSCIYMIVKKAMEWMAAHPAGDEVKASSKAWQDGEWLYLKLDKYNNGKLCALACP